MELQRIIQAAVEIGKREGFITFDQLNELCPVTAQPEDIEALMAALSDEGIQITDERWQMPDASCLFCGRSRQEVLQLVAGADGFICNECVQLCVQIISTKHPEWLPEHRKFVDDLVRRRGESPP